MIINRDVLNTTHTKTENITENFNMFEYTLEVAGVFNDDISLFMESFGDGKHKVFDFEAIIKAIIDAFINAIKSLFRKFLALLAKLASMGSSFEIELRAFKERIKAFRGEVKIDFPYYYYSNLGEEYPTDIYELIYNLIDRTDKEYNEALKSMALGIDKLADLEAKLNPQLEIAKYRGMLFNTRDIYSGQDFAKDVYNFFRSNNEVPFDKLTLDGSKIYNEVYEPYVNAKKEIAKIEKEKNKIERNAGKVRNIIHKDYFNANLINYDTADRQKLEQSTLAIERKLCTITDLMFQDALLVYGQKLQAYKDFRLQCRKVLIATIQAVIVQGG